MKQIFVRDEGVPAEKITVIPYGFDLKRWNASAAARDRVREELGLTGKVVFGALGRMYWVKNYPALFKAFAPFAAKAQDTMLLVVGDGPDREKLRQLVRELSLEDRIIFAGHRADIVDVITAIDVLVHAALAESFGQVVVEAFALCKPVVSTDVGVSREVVKDGINGFLVPTDNPESLRQALEKMLNARGRWEEMGRDGQQRIQRFSAEKIAPAYEAKYIEWLKEREKPIGQPRRL
jgi:glycosyltransferase involved in cell wall biosynthesis